MHLLSRMLNVGSYGRWKQDNFYYGTLDDHQILRTIYHIIRRTSCILILCTVRRMMITVRRMLNTVRRTSVLAAVVLVGWVRAAIRNPNDVTTLRIEPFHFLRIRDLNRRIT
jgi:hypothetical protein